MTRIITRGRLSPMWSKAFVDAPADREVALRKLVESTGAKMTAFYFTSGDCDFLMISEAEDAADVTACILGAIARGAITDINTMIAWTPAEFKSVGDKAKLAATAYVLPGQA